MVKYRPIFTRIWKDPDFEEYTTEQKTVFIYLCTNLLTTESGIYAISPKTIAQDTAVNIDTIKDILKNLKNVSYDFDNKVVFTRNFLEYNGGGRPDLVAKSIVNDYKKIKTKLWVEFVNRYPHDAKILLTVAKQLGNGSIPNPIPNPEPILNLAEFISDKKNQNNSNSNRNGGPRHISEIPPKVLKKFDPKFQRFLKNRRQEPKKKD